ncbi:MAG: glycosyltransferase [Candidatus Eisenbacteria bacterium]|uniref:Glycosyltransferase n=1 Tax=Eiseniibacteriota bacterium TaxID=2212470 RepID=A0A956RPG7_UNCEI|nr:glycosyltransferase [Candidatus Eisenbacteria bacterium]
MSGRAPSSLRITFVGTAHPMRGGLAQFNAALCFALRDRGHDVELISFTRQYPGLLFPGKSQYDESEEVHPFPATALVDSIGPWSWERAARHIARRRPQGLLFKFWMPFFAPAFGTIARRVKKRGDTRVVSILDNVIPHERRPFDLTLIRYFLGPVDGFLAMSRSVRDDLERLRPGARSELVPHPVYDLFGERIDKREARRRLGLDPLEPLLLFFGFVRDYKGLDLLLEALPEIRRRVPARLLVLGEFYSGKDRTQTLIRDLGLSEAVVLEDGYVPNERVGLAFSAADVVVLPYRSATQSGIVPIAYQLERPVICTDVGGLAEVVVHERTGLVCPPQDRAALARTVIRFYDEGWEDRLVQGIAEERTKYSWDRMAEAVERMLLATEPAETR